MPKWLSAAFALFLSLQVFGARGRAVDKLLSNYLYSFQDNTPKLKLEQSKQAAKPQVVIMPPITYRQPNLWCKTLAQPSMEKFFIPSKNEIETP